ncbi:hypothetical protein [Streptomyces antibioticus]
MRTSSRTPWPRRRAAGSEKTVVLSDFRGAEDNTPGRWEPVFADR